MKTDKISKISNKMESLYGSYTESLEGLKEELEPFVGFDFEVTYCAGDGHCILNVETSNVVPLDACIKVLDEEGFLLEETHESMCI